MQLFGTACLREWRHRLVASDPGLVRLASSGRATFGVATALVVEYLVAQATGAPSVLIPMMLGGVIAMMAAFGVSDPSRGGRAITLSTMALFMLAGMAIALLVDQVRLLSLAMFVVVMVVAVVIRRFGPRCFIGGMVAFMGYFFSMFLGLKLAQMPGILLAVAVGVAWAMLLSLVVLPVRHDRVLRRTVNAFEARVHRAVAAVDELVENRLSGASGEDHHGSGSAALRLRHGSGERVHDRLVGVTEAALMIDGQLGTPGAAQDDAHARAVRHAVADGELATRALVDAALRIGVPGSGGAAVDAVRRLLDELRAGHWDRVDAAAEAVTIAASSGAHPDAERLASVARGLVIARREWVAAVDGPSAEDGRTGFEPAVELFGGYLPGSAATVAGMSDDPDERGVLAGLALTTRQALQVGLATGLAVALGDALSGQRYYWAVLAAFLAFTGTATVAETVRKAMNRTLGTVVGLLAAIPLVALTGPSPAIVLPVMLASIFCGFYLLRVSYALMIFFITLLVGELYGLLGSFTPGLMVLRLEETALGAAIGIAVALLVTPTRTRSAATAARRVVLERLATLLDHLDMSLRERGTEVDLAGDARAVDAAVHQMLTVSEPMTRTATFAPDRDTRRRLMTCTTLAHHAGRLVRVARAAGIGGGEGRDPSAHSTAPAAAAAHLARLAERLAVPAPRVPRATATAVARLLSHADQPQDPRAPLVRELVSLHEALTTLADVRGFLVDEVDASGIDGGGIDGGGATHEVRGRILGPDLRPVAAMVTLVDQGGRGHGHARSDDGHFVLPLPADGSCLLVANPRRNTDEAPVAAAPHATRVPTGIDVALDDIVLPPPPRAGTRREIARTSSRVGTVTACTA